MRKRLNIEAIRNELEGSVFFPVKQAEERLEPKQEDSSTHRLPPATSPVRSSNPTTARNRASDDASMNASKRASTIASDEDLEHVRKILKRLGKEVLYVRLTPEEKTEVSDIEYTYERQGIKTSGNEVGRIALNFLLRDYKTNGEQSILAKVLAALHT